MKFLSKHHTSEIYIDGITYKHGADNSDLRLRLLNEQKNFCAYTEKYISGIDSTEVEHFNPSKKENDDYFNYYTTLRYANENKISKYPQCKNNPFFDTLFFHDKTVFDSRIKYEDYQYSPINTEDKDAKDFIDYLGLNDDYLFSERLRHIQRLQMTIGTFSENEKIEYFRRFKRDLSHVTAIEQEFNINLSDIIND
jgi:hypothetical protein